MRTEDETMYYVEEGLRVIIASMIAALCLLLYLIAIREREILLWAGISVALLQALSLLAVAKSRVNDAKKI